MKISLGLDPEAFLTDKDGKIISSLIAMKKNDKYDPVLLKHGVKIYSDNALVELAIPPSMTVDTCLARIHEAFRLMQEWLGSNYRISLKASHQFLKEELVEESLWEAGCNPSYDAYTGLANPKAVFTDGTRTGSFHIHIGHKKLDNLQTKMQMIRLLDMYLGLSSVIFDKDPTSPDRRKLYGRAGEFRPTKYGIEYRVLGNWALRSPRTTKLAYDIVMYAISMMEEDRMTHLLDNINPVKVQMAINNCDWNMANDILDSRVSFPSLLRRRIFDDYNGIDLYKDWGIKA